MGEGRDFYGESGQASIDYIVIAGSLLVIGLVVFSFYVTTTNHMAENLGTSEEGALEDAANTISQPGSEGEQNVSSDFEEEECTSTKDLFGG